MAAVAEKTPIALLIGRGSKVGDLIQRQQTGESSYQITSVITHKKEEGIGMELARRAGIRTLPFNYARMRTDFSAVQPGLDEQAFRREYSNFLGLYLRQPYPARPVAVLMQGWDIVLTQEALRYFPTGHGDVSWFINFHPAQLPDEPGRGTALLPSGVEIPVIKGEHDEVIQRAIDLKLPALGGCAHLVTPRFDEGGFIVGRYEVPILPGDTLDTYEARLKPAESEFTMLIAELVGQRRLRIENGKVITL